MKNKKDLLTILSKIEEPKIQHDIHRNNEVLIVDGANTFIRCFSIINHLNPVGNHIGGLTGFLKSIGYAVKFTNATRVIIVFEGEGSSQNKKNLFADYKANRDKTKIINWKVNKNKIDENESITNQMLRLIDYLRFLPVTLLSVDKVEGDDILAYCAKHLTIKHPSTNVTIMSADQDYLQLLNNQIKVFSPIKKILYNVDLFYKEYGIYPQNYCLYKTLLGDKGDNVPKIKGLGEKKIFNLLPSLKEAKEITLDESLKLVSEDDKWGYLLKQYEHQLRINWQLVDLHNPNIPEEDLEFINDILSKPAPFLDKVNFLQNYRFDKLDNTIPNVETWLDIFNLINLLNK